MCLLIRRPATNTLSSAKPSTHNTLKQSRLVLYAQDTPISVRCLLSAKVYPHQGVRLELDDFPVAATTQPTRRLTLRLPIGQCRPLPPYTFGMVGQGSVLLTLREDAANCSRAHVAQGVGG